MTVPICWSFFGNTVMIVFVAEMKGHTSSALTQLQRRGIMTGDGFEAFGVLYSNGIVSTEVWKKGFPSYLNAVRTALTDRRKPRKTKKTELYYT